MKHQATPQFWRLYKSLDSQVQKLADANYELLKADGRHPSLQFKKVGRLWSVRIGLHYRAVGVEEGSAILWFWIGHHSAYDRLMGKR